MQYQSYYLNFARSWCKIKPRGARGHGFFAARRVNIARFACNIQILLTLGLVFFTFPDH